MAEQVKSVCHTSQTTWVQSPELRVKGEKQLSKGVLWYICAMILQCIHICTWIHTWARICMHVRMCTHAQMYPHHHQHKILRCKAVIAEICPVSLGLRMETAGFEHRQWSASSMLLHKLQLPQHQPTDRQLQSQQEKLGATKRKTGFFQIDNLQFYFLCLKVNEKWLRVLLKWNISIEKQRKYIIKHHFLKYSFKTSNMLV